MSKNNKKNTEFFESLLLNDFTFSDYLNRLKRIAISRFEWVNLPQSMNSMFLEQSLYESGMCALLFDEYYGYINTKCAGSNRLNIYGLPTELNCYSFDFQKTRYLYTGLLNEKMNKYNQAILVMNDWDRTPSYSSLLLFAYRLYEAEQTAFINVKAQKTPVLIVVDEKQRLLMENLYSQYDGNRPYIFGDKSQLDPNFIKCLKTDAPFIANELIDYKKAIWNEALTFLGVNNLMIDKKERLISDEANSNNELINLNLQSYLTPRQIACEQFNELMGITDPTKKISVKIRSDLHNIIKEEMSVVSNLPKNEEVNNNGNIYN